MNYFTRFILLICGLFLLASCEDVVQIKLDEGSKIYVIDAFIDNISSTQKVRVSTNDSYFSNRESPPVSNAIVILKDHTAGRTFTFNYSGNGYYTATSEQNDPIAVKDHQYELNVTIEAITYTSLTTQKRTASIDSIGREYIDEENPFGPPGPPFYMCTLYAKDKVDNVVDYYWVKTFRNDSLLFGPSDINVSIDGTNGPVTGIAVDSTDFTPPITFIGFKQFPKGSTCKVEIHSLSREAYYMFLQASAQINNAGLFATTPENLKTNIITPKGAATKAVGWFNMASVASAKIELP
jgi:hypothetical protein